MQKSTKGPRILVVDDESPVRSLLREYLDKQGFHVVVADSAAMALELFRDVRPEVVITDVRMPDESGLELLTKIRELDSGIPVILVTAFPSMDDAIEALQEEAYDYLVKPFNLSELRQKIESALELRKLSRDNIILKEMASLHKVTSRLAATQDLYELVSLMIRQALQITGADYGSIRLVHANGRDLEVVERAAAAEAMRKSPSAEESEAELAKWAFRHKRSLLINKGRMQPKAMVRVPRTNIRSVVSIPLLTNNTVVGVLSLSNKAKDFRETDLNVIHVLASQAGVAIDNARTYQDLAQQASDLTAISEYSERLRERIETADVFACFFETLRDQFEESVDFAGVLYVDRGAVDFIYWSRFMVSRNYLERTRNFLLEELRKGRKWKKLPRDAILRNQQLLEPSWPQRLVHTHCHFTTPLLSHGICFGSVFLGSKFRTEFPQHVKGLLTPIVSQMCIALVNSRLYDEMKEHYFKTIKALAIAVDAKDTYTGGHSELVAKYAATIAKEMMLSDENVSCIKNAGLVHDIGKIGIPGHILNKPGLLTTEEFNDVMKSHSALGANIVKEVPFLQELHSLIMYHHEHYNGSGYPNHLEGEKIPLGARILAVADAYAAMTCDRPYRKSLGRQEACRRLWHCRGSQFDPDIVDVFLGVLSRSSEEESLVN